MAVNTDRAGNKPLIERRSIDYIPEAERHGRLFSQFTLWMGANLQITAIVTGALAVVLGGDVFWSLIGLLIGHAFDADWFKLRRDNPYAALGLTSDATDAEVDHAYRRLISQYHPDRMAGAAPELREQAEAKAREINAAYDRIKTLRKR